MARGGAASAALLSLVMLTACSAGDPKVPTNTVIDKFGTISKTVGPNGEAATPTSGLKLTSDEIEQLRSGDHRVAILWHELSAWSQAIQDGMLHKFAELGITVTATGDAKFDEATQANQIQSAVATKPEVILGQAVDPTSGAAAYRPAVDAGIKLIFADQAPEGYTYGKEYQAILTDDLLSMGQQTGSAMCKALGNKGTVGVIYYDADFHVTNFRDAAFLQTLHKRCPDVKIVAKQGFSDPNRAEEIARVMVTRFPDLSGIYVSWAVPAQGVLAALKEAGNTDTKMVTIDLDDTIAADMMSPKGHTAAIIVDNAYSYGEAMATAAALSILGKPAPKYGVSPIVTATRTSIDKGYKAWNQSVPAAVRDAATGQK
jgi:ribose transport system substrate-binding protein